ncbi:GtrA family protein [Saccharopolyspora halophila]|uniref:GtrA family protein n=1 Tax=Saccharopolyspora halophila TaxID=405551 RepID=UPI0031D75BC0
MLSRFAAASVIATVISQLVFLVSYSLGSAPIFATVLAWLAGAIPNFVLNRRTWGGGGRSALRGEIIRFGVISIGTALVAALAAHGAEILATSQFPHNRPAQIAIVWGAFAGTYVAMFAVKFVLFDKIVFTAHRQQQRAR